MYMLEIEAIGDANRQYLRLWSSVIDEALPGVAKHVVGRIPSRAWVARITGVRPIKREFIRPMKDYENAHGIGNRGVVLRYFLDDGIYEISAPESWKRTDRYFARIRNGELTRIERPVG